MVGLNERLDRSAVEVVPPRAVGEDDRPELALLRRVVALCARELLRLVGDRVKLADLEYATRITTDEPAGARTVRPDILLPDVASQYHSARPGNGGFHVHRSSRPGVPLRAA